VLLGKILSAESGTAELHRVYVLRERMEASMPRRVKHTTSLEERLAELSEQSKQKAKQLPHGKKRTELLGKVRQSEMALQISRWLSSPGLEPPKIIASLKSLCRESNR
jgi:hypothetical protein